mmetsp:Transcript_31373/g.76889  ORF Transcript_31373/g.76889 Transcript_31373/m.76889 type:complete len:219 (+) Transcript_31373:149-805(+)
MGAPGASASGGGREPRERLHSATHRDSSSGFRGGEAAAGPLRIAANRGGRETSAERRHQRRRAAVRNRICAGSALALPAPARPRDCTQWRRRARMPPARDRCRSSCRREVRRLPRRRAAAGGGSGPVQFPLGASRGTCEGLCVRSKPLAGLQPAEDLSVVARTRANSGRKRRPGAVGGGLDQKKHACVLICGWRQQCPGDCMRSRPRARMPRVVNLCE